MGILRSLLTGERQPALVEPEAPTFAVDSLAVPSQIFGLESYDETVGLEPRIDRQRAMQVPAVKRARDLVPGTLGTLPLELLAPDRSTGLWPLFDQPEVDQPRSHTMTALFEDLFFEGIAWWRVTERAWNGWPTKVRRLDPRSVTVMQDQRVYVDRRGHAQGTAAEWVPSTDLIRFSSPTDGLLYAGARAIRTCLNLSHAAAQRADGIPPVEWFTSAEAGVDPFADDAEAAEFLADWRQARRDGVTGYVPAALAYHSAGTDPDKLQLVETLNHAVLEIARLAGIDAEELSVSTTSRTYQNGYERRKERVDFTLAPYMVAVEGRLRMRDVTPRGYEPGFNLDKLLRADPKTRYEGYKLGREVGAITDERIADLEGVPVSQVRALPVTQPPAIQATAERIDDDSDDQEQTP